MKKYCILFTVIIFLFLIGCGIESQIAQESDIKEEFIELLKTPVEDYDVIYHKESSTAGSGTKTTISLSVQNNEIQSYKEETQWCGPGDPNEPRCKNCTKSYFDGNWQSCDCGEYDVCTQANKTTDAQLKADELTYLENSNISAYTFLAFNGSLGRKCFFYFSKTNAIGGGGLRCFREDGLLVNRYSSSAHPVILEVDGYESESVAKQWWDVKSEYLENDPEYQAMQKADKKEAIREERENWGNALSEIEEDAQRLYEKLDEAPVAEEQKGAIKEEIDVFIAEIQEQNALYLQQFDALLILAEQDIDEAKTQYNILNEELIQYQEAMDEKRSDIRREIRELSE